jgi:hypothetical protein
VGVPGRDRFEDIDQAFRATLAARFRNLIVWPHVQEIVLDVTGWWLASGLQLVEAAGIPKLDLARPDPVVYVLEAVLLSAYVRFSSCLRRLLDALADQATPADKLAAWPTALARTASPCPTLHDRLSAQQRAAERIAAILPPT